MNPFHIKHRWYYSLYAEFFKCVYCNAAVSRQTFQNEFSGWGNKKVADYLVDDLWNRNKPNRWIVTESGIIDTLFD